MIRKIATTYFTTPHGCEILARKINTGSKTAGHRADLPVDKKLAEAGRAAK